MAPLVDGSSLSAVTTPHGDRLYAQDRDGWIVEFSKTGNSWSEAKKIVEAAPESGFAAVWWNQLGAANSGLELYYLNKDFVLSDMSWRKDGEWFASDISKNNWKLYGKSQITAKVQQMSRSRKTDLRILVFGQEEDHSIKAFGYRSSWHVVDWDLGKGNIGTSLAVTDHKYQNRLFYFQGDKLVEMVPNDDGSWKTNPILDKAHGKGLSAYQTDEYKPRCYFVGQDNHPLQDSMMNVVAIRVANGSGGWSTDLTTSEIAGHSRIASCHHNGNHWIYVQRGTWWSEIIEVKKSSVWEKTNVIYTT